MYAVGRLGTLISQVSAPFHPFGGAVDIVVVEQQDGTFKSSPWYVRFGKFQGVLKAREKVVDINVNGEDASFHMYLDHTGGAYFLREVDAEEGDAILSPTFLGEEMEAQDRRPMKAKSWNYGDDLSDAVTPLEVSNGKVMSRSGSRRARFLGLGFGRKSMKENKFEEEEDGGGVVRVNSLECAEMAADLLEMKWSTNLGSVRKKKEDGSHLSAPDILDGVESKAEMLDEDGGLLDSGVSKVENRAIKCQSTIYYETLDTPRIELDNFGEQVNETTLLSCSKSGEVLVQEETSPDPELVTVRRLDDSTKEVLDSCSTLTVSSFSDSISQVQDGRSIEELDEMKRLCPFCDPQEVCSDVQTKVINNSSSVGLEEEQFIFSDLDDLKLGEVKCTEVVTSDGIKMMNEYFHSDFSSDSFPEKFVHTNLSNDGEELREEAEVISNQINISKSNKFAGEELRDMVRSCPNTRSHFDELDENLLHRPLGRSLDSSSKSLKWAMLRENVSSCIKSDAESVHHLSNSQPTTEDALNLEELKNVDNSAAVADSPEIIETASGTWSIWPFGYNRSRSMKDTKKTVNCTRKLDAEIALEGTIGVDLEKEVPKPKANKKKVRAISPTSEQLASLNLKEGKNIVTFTFSTAMLGKQQVDARIYLWRWDTRVVITDVDGTITKSDVLGQFMPLVGKDWSQTGVAHLFSAIKENGYQLLFLSARAISQAGLTRQFLFNLKQDGKGLPDGPVVISPDGLFPSLFREVIRRAPHEFKIACLEDIKACFPSERNPFYAGFGNRDTDEFSYLKVGIPKGKIFIINPKGVVVVNRCDNKSYTSLHALVNGMFPPTLSSEQEDFNSWNFWKLPPPLIDI